MDMEFLYFPENKADYIPALITLVVFMVGAVIAMYLFYKNSKKEAKKIDEKYKQAIGEQLENHQVNNERTEQ